MKTSNSKAAARWLRWCALLLIVNFSIEANAQQNREAPTVLYSIQTALNNGNGGRWSVDTAALRVSALEQVLDAVARRDDVVASQTGHSGSDAGLALQAGWLARYPEGTVGWQRLETRAGEERGNMARLALQIRNLSASERAEQLADRNSKGASEVALILLEQADTLPVLLTKAADWKGPDAGLWLACATYVAQRRPANETRTSLIKFADLDASFPDRTRRCLANYIRFIQSNPEFAREFRSEFSSLLNQGRIPYSAHAEFYPSGPIRLEAVPAIASQMMEWSERPHYPPDLGHFIQGMLMFESSSEKTGRVAALCRVMTHYEFRQTKPEIFLRNLIRQRRFERACADALAVLVAQPYNADNIAALLPTEHESPAARARVLSLAARKLRSRKDVDPIILQGLKKHWIVDWRSIEFKRENLGSRDPHTWLPHPLASWLEAAMGTTHAETISFLVDRWRNDPTAWPVMLALATCRDHPEVKQLFRQALMTTIRQRAPAWRELASEARASSISEDSLRRLLFQQSQIDRYVSQAIAVHFGHEASPIYLQAIAASTDTAEKCGLYDAAWDLTDAYSWAHPWQRDYRTDFQFSAGRWQYTKSRPFLLPPVSHSFDSLKSKIEAIRQATREPPDREVRTHLARSMTEALIPGLLECLQGADPFLAQYAKARVNPGAVFRSDPLSPPDKLSALESAWRQAAEKIK